MIYVLYGQPGSGKTSLGKLLANHLDTPFIIDGDEFREMFTNKNYGKEGREENIRNANAVATYLNKKAIEGNWKAVYIGDHQRDIQAAKNANVIAIAAGYGYINAESKIEEWYADFIVQQPEQIEPLLNILNFS